MKIATWDIETTNLKADVGRILCASVLTGRTMKSFRNDDIGKTMADDEEIAIQLRDYLEQFHMTIGWFSKGFDMSFVNTRLVKYGHKPIRSHLHFDPIWYCKGWRGLRPRSAKMKVMAEFFNVERKIDVDVDVWIDAAYGGCRKSMDLLVKRCEGDVRTTEKLACHILDTGMVKNIGVYP